MHLQNNILDVILMNLDITQIQKKIPFLHLQVFFSKIDKILILSVFLQKKKNQNCQKPINDTDFFTLNGPLTFLSYLFSVCITSFFSHGYLPESMLSVIIAPVIKDKAGNINAKDNYRPIALASIISKVVEIIMLNRMET